MKNILSVILTAFCICGCSTENSDEQSVATGNIYGVVTDERTAEPMKNIYLNLYYNNALVLRTITYPDGHYEFVDLKVGTYEVEAVVDGYDSDRVQAVVEVGRYIRADIQLTETKTVAEAPIPDIDRYSEKELFRVR